MVPARNFHKPKSGQEKPLVSGGQIVSWSVMSSGDGGHSSMRRSPASLHGAADASRAGSLCGETPAWRVRRQ